MTRIGKWRNLAFAALLCSVFFAAQKGVLANGWQGSFYSGFYGDFDCVGSWDCDADAYQTIYSECLYSLCANAEVIGFECTWDNEGGCHATCECRQM